MRTFFRRAAIYAGHTLIGIFVLVLILAVCWAFSYTVSAYHRRQAERLLQQLAALQPAGATQEKVKQIARDFGGKEDCADNLCSYDFADSFAFSNSGLCLLRRTEWDYVGLRPWQLTARIEVKNGQMIGLQLKFFVGRGRGWLYNEGLLAGNMWAVLMVSVESNGEQFAQDVKSGNEYFRASGGSARRQIDVGDRGIIVGKPNVNTPGSGEGLTVRLSPTAPLESRRTAFDIGLRCATAMSPCTHLCKLAPSAWAFYSQFMKANGLWVEEATECTSDTRH